MQRLATLVIVVIAFAVLGGGAYLYFKPQQAEQGWRGNGGPVPVDVVSVEKHEFADRISGLGTAQADESVTLTSRVSETVVDVSFSEGEYVEEGEILVKLRRAEQLAQLSEAQATLNEAESQLSRTRDLVSRGNASEATLDERIRLLEGAKSQIAQAEARIADRIIRAPFPGRTGIRQVSVGTLVSPGTAITTIDDITPIKLDFTVPERFISALQPDQQILARAAAYPDSVFRGTVTVIDTRIDPVTRAIQVRAEIANEDARLRPGMLMTVEVISRQRLSLAVPEEALMPVDSKQYVFIINDENLAERREVRIGLRRPGVVEILDGIEDGDQVVTAGIMRLRPGTKVEIVNRGTPIDRPQA